MIRVLRPPDDAGTIGGRMDPTADPRRLLAGLLRDGASLDINTIDLCFLAALYLRADRSMVSFEEDLLVDVFEQVCDVVQPSAENPRKRATHTIQRLREQRLLARVDGSGIVRAGEYALTQLASSVVRFFIADEALTRESLALLTRTLLVTLAEMRQKAARATTDEEWRTDVVGPLRVTIGDLVHGIERRERGMDVAQESVQREIGELLQADWFGAIDRCERLLNETSTTLTELNEVLLRDTHQILGLLEEIRDSAAAAGAASAEEATQRVIEHVDRVGAWGGVRHMAWSAYYQRVHRYLREVVRLDPDRALSARLRDQIAAYAAAPWYFRVAAASRVATLRPAVARTERQIVRRPREEREADPRDVAPEDAMLDLDEKVAAALAAGATTLADVTRRVLPDLDEDVRFVAAGRIAALVARRIRVAAEHERPWLAVDRFEIEDWTLPRT